MLFWFKGFLSHIAPNRHGNLVGIVAACTPASNCGIRPGLRSVFLRPVPFPSRIQTPIFTDNLVSRHAYSFNNRLGSLPYAAAKLSLPVQADEIWSVQRGKPPLPGGCRCLSDKISSSFLARKEDRGMVERVFQQLLGQPKSNAHISPRTLATRHCIWRSNACLFGWYRT